MSSIAVSKESSLNFKFTFENLFLTLIFILYMGCFLLMFVPSISAKTLIIAFFAGSMGVYIILITLALISDIFFPKKGRKKPRKLSKK